MVLLICNLLEYFFGLWFWLVFVTLLVHLPLGGVLIVVGGFCLFCVCLFVCIEINTTSKGLQALSSGQVDPEATCSQLHPDPGWDAAACTSLP